MANPAADTDEPRYGWFIIAHKGKWSRGTYTVTGCEREEAITLVRDRLQFCWGRPNLWGYEAVRVAVVAGAVMKVASNGK